MIVSTVLAAIINSSPQSVTDTVEEVNTKSHSNETVLKENVSVDLLMNESVAEQQNSFSLRLMLGTF